ncbi:MAG: hypothetical protein F6K48_20675 [Okeania sp. SIO3H1]|nr:hypothetical protein [Okeania sp. SIO3H1]
MKVLLLAWLVNPISQDNFMGTVKFDSMAECESAKAAMAEYNMAFQHAVCLEYTWPTGDET